MTKGRAKCDALRGHAAKHGYSLRIWKKPCKIP